MVFLGIFLGLLLLALGVAYGAYRFAYYSPHKNQNDPYLAPDGHRYTPEDGPTYGLIREMDELPFEPVTIRSRDGLQLFGRYYHVRDGAPLQIQMHGYRGHALRDFCGGNKLAREAGLNTLVVDQRAHGKSEGHTISFGINERWDCLGWAEYAAQRWPGVPISLAGISMGAATVLMASDLPLPEAVKGIIADCGYSSPRAIIKHVCWSLPKPFRIFYPFTSLSAELFGHFDPDAGSALGAVSNTTPADPRGGGRLCPLRDEPGDRRRLRIEGAPGDFPRRRPRRQLSQRPGALRQDREGVSGEHWRDLNKNNTRNGAPLCGTPFFRFSY